MPTKKKVRHEGVKIVSRQGPMCVVECTRCGCVMITENPRRRTLALLCSGKSENEHVLSIRGGPVGN